MNPTAALQPPHGIFELEPSSTLSLTMFLLWFLPLLFLLLALGIWWWKRRQDLQKPLPPPEPWQELSHRLVKLDWRETLPADYFATLSTVLREGLERQQGKPFSAWTRKEVLRELQQRQAFSSDFQANCAEFLETAERIQYAGQSVDETAALVWKERVAHCLRTIQEPST